MNDMSQVIIPKSDQWNADDFIAGPATFTISEVRISTGSEQPVSIVLEGSDKFYRPCKSMSRVLVQAWGPDAKAYIGRSLTLYRDPTVKWAGMEIGGIRISHMSHIDGAKQMMLTATKGSRKPFKVLPLVMQQKRQAQPASGGDDAASRWTQGFIAKLDEFTTVDAVQNFAAQKATKLAELADARPDLHEKVTTALATRTADLKPPASSFDDDDFGASASGETASADQPADTAAPANSPAENITENITADDDPHPGTAIADAIIAEIEDPMNNAVMDVSRILSKHELDLAAMRDEDAVRVEVAADKRRKAIRDEQEAARVKEAAE
jgi:hypothetical protein